MWEIDNLSQLLGFLYSVVLGIIFCLVYDVLRAFRAEIKFGTAAVFAADILYSVFCAVTCFCFMTLRAALFLYDRISLVSGKLFTLIAAKFEFLLKKAEKICDFSKNTLKKHLKKK